MAIYTTFYDFMLLFPTDDYSWLRNLTVFHVFFVWKKIGNKGSD